MVEVYQAERVFGNDCERNQTAWTMLNVRSTITISISPMTILYGVVKTPRALRPEQAHDIGRAN